MHIQIGFQPIDWTKEQTVYRNTDLCEVTHCYPEEHEPTSQQCRNSAEAHAQSVVVNYLNSFSLNRAMTDSFQLPQKPLTLPQPAAASRMNSGGDGGMEVKRERKKPFKIPPWPTNSLSLCRSLQTEYD